MRARAALALFAVALVPLGVARPASADEPVAAREPRLMSETSEITTVADAFDRDDPFDLNLVLGFQQSWKAANIHRETQLFQQGTNLATGGFIPATENVAKYSSSMSTLLVGADVGIYRDFALILRLPVILSWAQQLDDLNGSQNTASGRLQDPIDGSQMFPIPFKSPTRSGIDYFSAGLDWAIYNQQRDLTKPTWTVGVEGRFGVGEPLHACNANPAPGVSQCPDPVTGANRDPGISRAMTGVQAKSIWSRRFGYVEPYSGFFVLAEFQQDRSDFGKWNPANNLTRTPPLQGSFMMGLEVIPYEHREQFQRLSADFRFKGTYRSPGRDYTELFDALGSSQSPSLRAPNPSQYIASGDPNNPSVVDPNAEKVYFTGITETQAYGAFTGSAAATWQAGEYIKFQVGSSFTYVQSHLATAADTCNPNNGNSGNSGPCRNVASGTVNGVPNPDHRDVIDLPGHRLSVDDTQIWDLWVMGIVMF